MEGSVEKGKERMRGGRGRGGGKGVDLVKERVEGDETKIFYYCVE